jgi:hypothetical protein
MSGVPYNWIPFVPQHVGADEKSAYSGFLGGRETVLRSENRQVLKAFRKVGTLQWETKKQPINQHGGQSNVLDRYDEINRT